MRKICMNSWGDSFRPSAWLLLSALAVGCGHDEAAEKTLGQAEPTEMQRDAIRGGTPTGYAAAAIINIRKSNGQDSGCSGALISPYVVLTAGHCVEVPAGVSATWDVRVPSLGQTVSSNQIRTRYVGTGTEAVNLNSIDVGLILLPSPINLLEYPSLDPSAVANGNLISFLGRRNNETRISPDDVAFFASPPATTTSALGSLPYAYLTSPQLTDPGDSGGPVLLSYTNEIIGVNSGVGNIGTQSVSATARIDGEIYTWIQGQLAGYGGLAYPHRSPVNVIAAKDFNGDGKDDFVLHNRETGDVSFSFDGRAVAGATLAPKAGTPAAPRAAAPWYVVATADFNGDGQNDLLWQNRTTGQVVYWYLKGTTFESSALLPAEFTVGPPWYLIGTGDFNGDGKADLLWQNVDGTLVYWYMNNTTRTGFSILGNRVGVPWHLVGTGDFNQDGKTDLLWHNWAAGEIALWYMDGLTLKQSAFVTTTSNNPSVNLAVPPPWYVVGAGDVNRDGKSDLLWQNKVTGQTAYWFLNGSALGSSELH